MDSSMFEINFTKFVFVMDSNMFEKKIGLVFRLTIINNQPL